ncbi:methyltransferase [Bradyrhizobium sp. CB3481]|uniref:methyltransferase n=1 Tax=Bradyrhizobium sp. CB3481 TaxID=3039158 RepID=UPI0024B08C4E|nr:methyltransferase [Bradyrhizobium sp. CB3481]WFU19927.1 methyltransferase [Bradyrhizobium sp. CB3481]
MVAVVSQLDSNVPDAQALPPAGVPPHVQLIQMGVAIWQARAVYAAAELGIADILADGPCSVAELAVRTGTHAPSLFRLLRALASCGLIEETWNGQFMTTTLGDALREGAPGSARATILTIAGSWQWKAWDQFLQALRTGESGMKAAFGKDLFGFLADEPLHSARFNDAMIGMHGAVASAVAAACDFSQFKSIVDVGGGKGALLNAILKDQPQMRGILFDLPETARAAREFLASSGLDARCAFQGGNFFEHVPPGHDVYVLGHVLHDWNDDDSVTILRKCREAMSSEARLLIVEAVLPDGNTPHHGKLMDLLMLTVTGGVERSRGEFARILAKSGFALSQVHPTGTHQSVIEAIPT